MHKIFTFLFLAVFILSSCKGQSDVNSNNLIGGPCEDCEAALDYDLLEYNLRSVDSLPGFLETDPKIKIEGTVFKSDGKTPAENIILYVYHTNRDGIYEPSESPIGWEKRHGKYRGWVKTDAIGRYAFYTFRPAPYPQVQEPEHIHLYVKEPNKIPYYIDNYVFFDDPTLNQGDIDSQTERGGSGLIKLSIQSEILTGHRDIILGLNIPNYID